MSEEIEALQTTIERCKSIQQATAECWRQDMERAVEVVQLLQKAIEQAMRNVEWKPNSSKQKALTKATEAASQWLKENKDAD